VLLDPRLLAGIAAAVIAALLTPLYAYRRRSFISFWMAGWALQSVSFLAAARTLRVEQFGWMVYGASQFLGICSGLSFLLAAEAYRHRLKLPPRAPWVLLPGAIWFVLAPMALGPRAAYAPGHLLIAAAFVLAAYAHLRLLRQARMLGATIIGASFAVIAAFNAWASIAGSGPDSAAASTAVIVSAVVYLALALGMQLMTFEDMTFELRRTNRRLELAQTELRELAITDALTGCRNRRFFGEVIDRELRRHRRYNLPLSILFVDIDRFKSINDTLGHETGDRVLRDTAAFLVRSVRDADYVFRWGGDEFLILITAPEEEARRRGRQLAAAFVASPEAKQLPPGVALSVGCIQVPTDTADVMTFVQRADERMYADKKSRPRK
jgi:diguanylate cyclase (GGDEF)-like protein